MLRIFIALVLASYICAEALDVKEEDVNAYEILPTGRYYVYNVAKNWKDSYAFCRNRSSHLVVINSQLEADIVSDLMSRNAIDNIHVGFHDLYQEGKFINIHDQSVNSTGYSSWATGHPLGSTLFNCGGFNRKLSATSAAGLSVQSCTQTIYKVICEERLWDGYDFITSGPNNSTTGFYKLHNELRTWPDAWETCRLEGAHLLIVNSEHELITLLNKYGLWGYVWVGVHQLHGSFVTIFNDDLSDTGYSKWIESHPILDSVLRSYVGVANNIGLVTQLTAATSKFICEHSNVSH